MADPQIVSCPGCGKRYSVPEGAAPGQFQCQDCSAVVAYGRGGQAPAAKGPGNGASARTHAKAAAAKRRNARNRHEEEDDDGDDRPGHGRGHGDPKKKDSSVYVMAIVGLVVFVGAAIVMVNKSGSDKPKPVAAAPKPAGTPATGVFVPEEDPAPAPAPAPKPTPLPAPKPVEDAPKPTGAMKAAVRGGVEEKPDNYTPAANPPTGGNYGKSQAALLMLLKDRRAEVWVDPGHLPDTAADLAQTIDADIAKMADVNGGSEGFKAQDRLIKIGRPAIPRVVGLLSRVDFTKYSTILEARDACILGDAIDHVLREITGYDKVRQLQYSPQNGKITDYMESLDAWCLWWYTLGYKRETFYRTTGAAEDEKL